MEKITEDSSQQGQDRGSSDSISTPISNAVLQDGSPDNQGDKPIISHQSEGRNASRVPTPVISSNAYTAPEQIYVYGGYDDGSVNWGDYSNYVHPNNLQIMSPAIYNDNASLYHPAYAFDNYGQFSPIANPLSPIIIDGQIYSPYQIPISPSYYSQTPTSSSQEGLVDNGYLGHGSGYYLHYPVNNNNNSGFYYPENVPGESGGILGPYEHSFGQIPHQYATQLNHHGLDNQVKHVDRNSVNLTVDSNAATNDRNRGPRSTKPKESGSPNHTSNDNNNSVYNYPDFVTNYEKAKFFVIKSFSEDNVHRSIKYGVWASTPLGNRKLNAAYQEATENGSTCPIFLFFSVNASGQFCGVAEMIGPVDFENDAEYWQQDRWSGQFRVKWHIIKDVPNSRFRHILLENNDNKPVTHSRDSQEVNLEEGIAMLKIFKEHEADTSILDDFYFYDEREKCFQEKRAKEQTLLPKNVVDDASINQISDRIADSLQLEKDKEAQ